MIKLQNLIYPSTDNCTEEPLYFRRFEGVTYSLADDCIKMDEKAFVTFDTYFNSFSASKWFKYTTITNVGIHLKLKGKFRVSLLYKEKQASQIFEKVVGEFYCDTKGSTIEENYRFDTEYNQGIYCFNILSMEDDSQYYGGYYYTNPEGNAMEDIHLALIICTYNREKYIYRNIKMLCKEFLQNTDSELHGSLEVIISDNAQSLDRTQLENEKIHIFNNKNTGGSGGFTRGLIESIKLSETKKLTHVILMDDDIVIQPESIYRTYRLLTLLKEKYKESYIGGAMLRTDRQWLQTESGASWNCGQLVSHKQGLDLRNLDACLYNEIEEKCEYHAWWYCTIPMKFVRKDNLPLPIFIRGDDVEYGLRNMKYLILMNGICVWHEPFENKYSSSLYYYIFRNKLIDNAVHQKPYSRKQFLSEFRQDFMREVFTLRYKNAWLLLEGVNDFLKGMEWFAAQDGEKLNQSIMEKGYRLQEVEELSIPFSYSEYERILQFCESKKKQLKRKLTLNGLFLKPNRSVIVPIIDPHIAYFYKAYGALNYDVRSKKGFETYKSKKETLNLFKAYRDMKKHSKKCYAKVMEEFRTRKAEITNIEFWEEYLKREAENGK